MLEWFYACTVTKYQNFGSILHFWYSLFQFHHVFANSCELTPTLAILLILCILMRLPAGDRSMLCSSLLAPSVFHGVALVEVALCSNSALLG